MNVSDPTRFEFEAACPQCGAAAVLQAGQNVLSCPFCKTRQVLIPSGEPVFIILPTERPENLFFAPYWLFQGLYVHADPSGMNERRLDASFSASKDRVLPFSIGQRCQVLKLHALLADPAGLRLLKCDYSSDTMRKAVRTFMSRGAEAMRKTIGAFTVPGTNECPRTADSLETTVPVLKTGDPEPLPPLTPDARSPRTRLTDWIASPGNLTRKISEFWKWLSSMPLEPFPGSGELPDQNTSSSDPEGSAWGTGALSGEPHPTGEYEFEDFMEDRLALVYFPYFVRERTLLDGITMGPASNRPLPAHRFKLSRSRLSWTAHPLLCPNCGMDLPAHPDALCFPCGHCGRMWEIREARFNDKKVEEEVPGRPFDVRFPFWRMAVRIDGISGWGTEELPWEPSAMVFSNSASISREIWAPAFRMAPLASLTAAARITRKPPAVRNTDSVQTRGLFPVTLPLEGAFSRCRMILFHQATLFAKFAPKKPGIFGSLSFHLDSAGLAYLPFSRMGTEYIHEWTQYALSAPAIRGITRVEDVLPRP